MKITYFLRLLTGAFLLINMPCNAAEVAVEPVPAVPTKRICLIESFANLGHEWAITRKVWDLSWKTGVMDHRMSLVSMDSPKELDRVNKFIELHATWKNEAAMRLKIEGFDTGKFGYTQNAIEAELLRDELLTKRINNPDYYIHENECNSGRATKDFIEEHLALGSIPAIQPKAKELVLGGNIYMQDLVTAEAFLLDCSSSALGSGLK